LCTPVQTAPESYPALRKFAALIQSYGDCRDPVAFVDGEQPYGTGADYQALLSFYTGRPVVSARCEELPPGSVWVIASGSNIERCRGKFPTVIRYGRQALLTSRVTPEQALDLTWQSRELSAPIDCRAEALPTDRYHGL